MKKPDPTCEAFQTAIDLLARPWTGLILGLLQNGPLRFSELQERALGVGAKTLSARLKELEARRVVARHVEAGPPVRVQYTLTAKGRAFEQVAAAVERWGRELVGRPAASTGPVRAVLTRLPARRLVLLAALVALGAGVWAAVARPRWAHAVFPPRSPRNLLLVSIDTLRADHLGCYGYAGGADARASTRLARSRAALRDARPRSCP